ncbi:MAG: hypothetical protein ACC635_05065 [Acidiferrobacterales bacterium]
MLIVTVNALDSGSRHYNIICNTHLASDLENVDLLFETRGKPGMTYQYLVSNQNNGKTLALYYSNRLDVVESLTQNYRHVST